MKLTEMQRREYPKTIDSIEAVAKLASANFPRTTEILLKTAGSSPSASITINSNLLKFLIAAGRRALTTKEGGDE